MSARARQVVTSDSYYLQSVAWPIYKRDRIDHLFSRRAVIEMFHSGCYVKYWTFLSDLPCGGCYDCCSIKNRIRIHNIHGQQNTFQYRTFMVRISNNFPVLTTKWFEKAMTAFEWWKWSYGSWICQGVLQRLYYASLCKISTPVITSNIKLHFA